MADLTEPPVLLVSVGTDHHPFARLSGWVESWLAQTATPVRCVVQEGSTPAPRGAEPIGLVDHADLLSLMERCTVLVCHGGPGTITDARRRGLVPVVVPRLSRYGEAVDDHQVSFVRHASRLGWVTAVESEEALHAELDRRLAAPESAHRSEALPDTTPTVQALEERVRGLDGRFRPVYVHRIPAGLRGAVSMLRHLHNTL